MVCTDRWSGHEGVQDVSQSTAAVFQFSVVELGCDRLQVWLGANVDE